MKKVNKRNFNSAIQSYLNKLKTCNYFFCGSYDDELKYLNHHRVRYYFILRKLEDALAKYDGKNVRIMEMGFSPMSYILGYFLNIESLSIADHNIQYRERADKIDANFIHIDFNKEVKLSEFFDFILFHEVFEHIFCDEEKILKTLIGCLKSDGYLFFSTPNYFSLKNLLRFFSGQSLSPLNKEIIFSDGSLHVREYGLKEILSILSGIDNIAVTYCNYERYFDNFSSLMVYRKNKFLAALPVLIYLIFPTFFKKMRIGIYIIIKKTNENIF
jgi:SAM-dependent methyltransferase